MDDAEIARELESLQPGTPWSHYFKFGQQETISPERNEQFYKKAIGLRKLGEHAVEYARYHTRAGSFAGQRVLDIASAEGGHSILFAQAGAKSVLGVEGRQLYLDRSRFAARALGVENVEFQLGDVRKIDPEKTGAFDIVFCSGILHHLGQPDFWPMLKLLRTLTTDTMFLYTHVSTPHAVKTFRLKETTPVEGRYQGYLFQEHEEAANEKQRIDQVRASLDNTYSFWATPESLIDALRDAGFKSVSSILHPHLFGKHEDRAFRPIIAARV